MLLPPNSCPGTDPGPGNLQNCPVPENALADHIDWDHIDPPRGYRCSAGRTDRGKPPWHGDERAHGHIHPSLKVMLEFVGIR